MRCAALAAALVLTSGCARTPTPFDLDADQIRSDTEYQCQTWPSRVTGTEAERSVCDWLEAQLESLDFSRETGTLRRSAFTGLDELTSENLTAVCNQDPGLPLVSVVTHYDSYPGTPGAGDNAVSVAILLEIARYLGPENQEFPCELRLVFLGSEENGYHGSRSYVDGLSETDRARHLGAYNMDISAGVIGDGAVLVCNTLGALDENGFYQAGDFLEPAENAVARTAQAAYRELYGQEPGGIFHVGESDQVSFHNRELEAANVCWRAVGPDGFLRIFDGYHRESDTPDALDYDTARATGRCILRGIQLLCA